MHALINHFLFLNQSSNTDSLINFVLFNQTSHVCPALHDPKKSNDKQLTTQSNPLRKSCIFNLCPYNLSGHALKPQKQSQL